VFWRALTQYTATHTRARAAFIMYGKCCSTKKQAPVQFVRSHALPASSASLREGRSRSRGGEGVLREGEVVEQRELLLRERNGHYRPAGIYNNIIAIYTYGHETTVPGCMLFLCMYIVYVCMFCICVH